MIIIKLKKKFFYINYVLFLECVLKLLSKMLIFNLIKRLNDYKFIILCSFFEYRFLDFF